MSQVRCQIQCTQPCLDEKSKSSAYCIDNDGCYWACCYYCCSYVRLNPLMSQTKKWKSCKWITKKEWMAWRTVHQVMTS